jgi:hypothetical protein
VLLSGEQRRAQRYQVILPLRIISVSGQEFDVFGETRDVAVGGVRGVMLRRFSIGEKIEFVVSLPRYHPCSEVQCVGTVLRCSEKYAEESYEIAATIETFHILQVGVDDLQQCTSESLSHILEGAMIEVEHPSHYPIVDLERHRQMTYLLSNADCDRTTAPALTMKLRAHRAGVFREYLRALTIDHATVVAQIRLIISQSDVDRPDLEKAVVKSCALFVLASSRIRVRLGVYVLGIGTPEKLRSDIMDLVDALDFLLAHFNFLTESVVWGPGWLC